MAFRNKSRTRLAPTPTNNSTNSDAAIEKNGTPASPAIARANSVFPVPGGPINSLSEVFTSDQVEARGMKISMPDEHAASGGVPLIGNPVKFSKTPVSYRHAPPACGADTQDVLDDLLKDS